MHPVFHILGFSIHAYGLMIAVAVVLGSRYITALAKRAGLDPDPVMEAFALACVAGVAGARLLYVIEFYGVHYAGQPWTALLRVQDGGLVFYGGVIAAVSLVPVFLAWRSARARRAGRPAIPILRVCDVLSAAMPIGLALGRVGCFLNGCCWGLRDTTGRALLAVSFPPGSPAFESHVERYGLPETAACSYAVHATQLYECGAALLLLVALGVAWRRASRDGQVLALVGVLYGPIRYVIEALREHDPGAERNHVASWLQDPIAGAPMTNSQLVSLGMFVGGVIAFILARRFGPERPAPAPAPATAA